MAGDGKRVIRMSWDEWEKGRASRREALARMGLDVPCRRTTAKPRAVAALNAILQDQQRKQGGGRFDGRDGRDMKRGKT